MSTEQYVPRLVYSGKSISIIYLVIILTAIANTGFYALDRTFNNKNILFAAGISILVLIPILFLLDRNLKSLYLSERKFACIIALLSIPLLAVQGFIIYSVSFQTGWDPKHVFMSAMQFANGESMTESLYFSRYPNNFGLLISEILFIKIAHFFGIYSEQGCYIILEWIGYVLITLSLFFMALILYKITKSVVLSLYGWFVGAIWIGISPWGLIPYTDSYAIIFTTLGLYWYICKKNSIFKWVVLVITILIGSWIKPTVAILLLAIFLVESLCILIKREKLPWQQVIKGTACILFAVITITSIQKICVSLIPLEIDKNQEFGIAHFAMMGLNKETHGIYSDDDIAFSSQFASKEERTNNNIKVWKERICTLKAKGLLDLAIEKTKLNYGDGTFLWAGEGSFFDHVYGDNIQVQKFYGITQPNGAFRLIAQFIWSMMLLLSIFGVFNVHSTKEECVAYITILGIGLFLLIFECRGRYLFLYSPYYIITSIWTIHNMIKFYCEKSTLKFKKA